ncbi:MAG: glycine cleavage system protein GcvH [Ignavibacteria bacterium]|nr:glycine cleavage system protein GcvH [Ignavibacteria bacterium]
MNVPENLRYTKDHEWILIDGKTGTIGITDYAQEELGDIVFVELPGQGTKITAGETFGTIEAVKAVSDLVAPVSGTVESVNTDLEGTPELVNQDPYGKGWMLKVTLSGQPDQASLLDQGAYRKHVGK